MIDNTHISIPEQLHFYASKDLNELAVKLAQNIDQADLGVFKTIEIVTQTKGMNNWLEINMAKQLDIFINYRFRTPMSLILEIYYSLEGKRHHHISDTQIVWLLYDILGSKDFAQNFSKVAQYFKNDDLKRIELAKKMADLFDQYQIYRYEMIKAWNNNHITDAENHLEAWQAYLWQKVKMQSEQRFADKTTIKEYIINALKDKQKTDRLKQDFAQIHLFGLSSFTQYHIDIYHQLAEHIPVFFYLINHAPDYYWAEEVSAKQSQIYQYKKGIALQKLIGNELLTNWGKLVQESISMLYKNGEFINVEENLSAQNIEMPATTLLQKVQHSIHENLQENEYQFELKDLQDGSIVISSNYSIIREVESLYNYLISTIDTHHRKRKDKVTTRDILVIVNDINAYAPYIKAVFDNAPHQFLYNISDNKIVSGNNIIASVVALLQLNEENFTAENVLQLLTFPSIKQKARVKNVDLLRTAAEAANIRYGFENDIDDDTYLASFSNGLKRLMYGICIDGEVNYEDEFITANIVDGNMDFLEIIAFQKFVQQLHTMIKRRTDKSLKEWQEYIEWLMNTFIAQDDVEDFQEYSKVLQRINDMDKVEKLVNDKSIPFAVFNSKFIDDINQLSDEAKYLTQGITFCSPIPFRSIPFKIIGLLGLNYSDFPRKERRSDLDLIRSKDAIGDRNIKHNDKHLFLESLMSAKSYLYLSYIGKDVKTNKDLPPSILVDELLEYIDKGVSEQEKSLDWQIKKIMVSQQPLHSFSSKYNQENAPKTLLNYFIKTNKISESNTSISSPSFTLPAQITLRDMEIFCENTLKYYYNKVLGIYINDEDKRIADTEIFVLNNLESWFVKDLVLEELISEEEKIEQAYKKGHLPLKNIKDTVINDAKETAETVYNLMKANGYSKPIKTTLSYTTKTGIVIINNFEYQPSERISMISQLSKSNEKYIIRAFAKLLFGKVTNCIDQVILVTPDKAYLSQFITQDEAKIILEKIVEKMTEMYSGAISIFSIDLIKKLKSYKDDVPFEEYISKAIESISDNEYNFDPYLSHAYESGLLDAFLDKEKMMALKSLIYDNAVKYIN